MSTNILLTVYHQVVAVLDSAWRGRQLHELPGLRFHLVLTGAVPDIP